MSVMIATSLGELVIDLFTDRCPLTCKNFLKLCKIKYYNGCLFHMVQKDFTAQTGDPTGTGSGGDSIYKFLYGDQARFFNDEIFPDLKHSKMGTVAMASAGENLNASQFYITLRDDIDSLDEKHTVFGEVAEGLDTLTRINEAYVDDTGRPFKNIRIKHTYVLEDPFEDPSQLTELIPDASPEGKPKDEVTDDVRLEDDWEPLDEQLAPDELEEVIRTKEAHSRAVVLESIGDIPDADVKPPENVLFVCKLNPVTEDEDLHTIFSRFGTVTSAEVIRDFKTGDSLCYAFIEFENNEACERAYFKMDNALIDDRRIKVDFSQSVSKLWNQFRRKGNQGGKGCFKCGELDHLAKDCTMGSTNPGQQPQKFVLKHDNNQRGDKDSGYEMVFDEDGGSPHRTKKHRDYEQKDRKKQKIERSGYDNDNDKHKSYGNRDSKDRERQHHKNDEHEETENDHGRDDRRREGRYSSRSDDKERENGHGRDGRREGRYSSRSNDRERETSHGTDARRKESRYGDGNKDREKEISAGRDDRRKESKHGGRSDRDPRERRSDEEYKKKTTEIDRYGARSDRSPRERRNDVEYRKKTIDTDRRDKRDETSRKKDAETDREKSRQDDHHRRKADDERRRGDKR